MHRVSRQDIDRLVAIAEREPEFKKSLQTMDELAKERKCELKDVIQTAVDWYFCKFPEKRYN